MVDARYGSRLAEQVWEAWQMIAAAQGRRPWTANWRSSDEAE